ncbi:hypothetical protein DH2020_042978 [Rehmannia glutinosa]|uniref:Pentatricopeptide repeat-containing protein n=1 Tax=Rehmannia glutinosa TaxID=99300 RepID=A0ABR0UM60_REHGL
MRSWAISVEDLQMMKTNPNSSFCRASVGSSKKISNFKMIIDLTIDDPVETTMNDKDDRLSHSNIDSNSPQSQTNETNTLINPVSAKQMQLLELSDCERRSVKTMLRAKHLGTLSQSARSFFLSGSRCSAADGSSSCTCSDDETCISRRHLRANVQHIGASSSLLSKASVGVSPLASLDSVKEVNAKTTEHNSTLSQGVAIACSLDRAEDSVSYADDFDVHSSPPIADQFVKAGMAAVGLLSDLVNYRIPMMDGSSMLTSSRNSMVDRTKPISNVRSANTKNPRKDKVYVKPSAAPNFTSGATGSGDRSVSEKGVTNESNNFAETHGISSEPRDRVKSIPQRARANSNRFMPNTPQSDGFTRAIRQAKKRLSGSSTARSTPTKLNQVLKQLQDYTVALGFFYWLKRTPGFKHDGHTYTTMVGILGRARQFGAINKLLDQMVSDGCKPNVVTYNRLIHSYGRANYLNEALSVFNQMQNVGCEPDRVTYCTLIDIHAKSGYLDVAIDMYQRMQEVGLSPDTFTYSVIINCLGKAGHLAAAHKLFCEMVNQGCVPNLVTYNIMIALHAKARNYQSSLQLYRDMQSAGFEPDKVTYSIVMEVLGHCGYLDEAEAVFAEMKRKIGFRTSPFTVFSSTFGEKPVMSKRLGNGIEPCLVLVYARTSPLAILYLARFLEYTVFAMRITCFKACSV